jgi:hypothetical protein
MVTNLSDILEDIHSYSTAILLYSPINTKNIYPPIKKEFNEKTIYNAFIYYCNFTKTLPIPENILPLCNQKPLDIINFTDSREEIIKKLKESGVNYSLDSFLRLIQIISRNNLIHVDLDNTLITSLRKFTYLLEEIRAENETTIPSVLLDLFLNVIDTFDIGMNEISKETKDLNNYLIKEIEYMKSEIIEFLRINKGRDVSRGKMNEVTNFINSLSEWSQDKTKYNRNIKNISNESVYNYIQFTKNCIDNFVKIFPNIILNKVDYNENYIPKYLGLSKNHAKNIETIIREYYSNLRSFYDISSLGKVLEKIQRSCDNLTKLSKNTPTFITINEIKPIFDERTSKFIFEYYLLKTIMEYIHLSDQPNMIVKLIQTKNMVSNIDIVSVDYLDETNTVIDTNIDIDNRTEFETNLLSGDKKELKQKTANLLIEFLRIMNTYKETIDVSYDEVLDRIFKLKEREKNLITDRLKSMDDEARDADTILKINKLGVWSKGLQKGLTTYVKETYDEEREFMEKMLEYERKAQKKLRESNIDANNLDLIRDDLIEEMDRENEIEREANDISMYNEDFMNGQFEGDDVDIEESEYY